MLDLKLLRNNIDEYKALLGKKKFILDVDQFNALDQQRRQSESDIQKVQTDRNKTSKQVGELIKSGLSVDEAKEKVASQLAEIDDSLVSLQKSSKDAQQKLEVFLLDIPNLPDVSVPDGDSEDDNVIISHWGQKPSFDFEVEDHVALGEQSNRKLDIDVASKITGSRFSVMKGELALLHRALIQFMLDTHIYEHGYEEMYVPYIVNKDSLLGTGQLPKFEKDLFKIDGLDYYLIPTAEVPLTNLLRDVTLDIHGHENYGALPIKFVAHTPCFRSEAGSYGRDTRGLIRQHQFEKVELVQFVQPEMGEAALEALTEDAENILRKLELPYRKVLLCGGDLGFSSKKTYDLEVWLPSQNQYREISSCSYFDSFQSRRMLARYKLSGEKKLQFLHTLNGSGLAVGRCLLAILENFQNEDGSVQVPHVLQSYMKGKEVLFT
jgi:seryl-tRNA synthetase